MKLQALLAIVLASTLMAELAAEQPYTNGDGDELDIFSASQNDWTAIVFGGGQVGDLIEGFSSPEAMSCLDP